mmetsp:Transcript_167414/g.532192  ORF Transcript_167414/g.532192 Transcript_167414/m.532192 type:complete len:398 (-) Transcript_167414:976-2169(-)
MVCGPRMRALRHHGKSLRDKSSQVKLTDFLQHPPHCGVASSIDLCGLSRGGSDGQFHLPILDAIQDRHLLQRVQQVVGTNVPAHHHRGHPDAREGAVATHVQPRQRRLVARQHVRRQHARPVASVGLAEEFSVREGRAHELQHDAVPDIRHLFLDRCEQEVPGLLFFLLVLVAILAQACPLLPRLGGRRVGVKAMVAGGCKGGVQHRRAAHEHRVAGSLEVVPMLEDSPLRRELLAVLRGQAVGLEAQVQVNKRLQLWKILPRLLEVLLKLRGGSDWDQVAGHPPIGVGDHGLARAEDAAILQADAHRPVPFHEDLLNVGLKQDLAPRVLVHTAYEGAHQSLVAALWEVQARVLPVKIRHHVRHHTCWSTVRRQALQQEREHVHPMQEERIGHPGLR